jgi:uncharacterized surface protein with fasciclin (FAS1) repeats
LRHFILNHVLEGQLDDGTVNQTLGGTTVRFASSGTRSAVNNIAVTAGPINLEGIRLYILDRTLVSSDQLVASSTVRLPGDAEFASPWRGIKRRIRAILE